MGGGGRGMREDRPGKGRDCRLLPLPAPLPPIENEKIENMRTKRGRIRCEGRTTQREKLWTVVGPSLCPPPQEKRKKENSFKPPHLQPVSVGSASSLMATLAILLPTTSQPFNNPRVLAPSMTMPCQCASRILRRRRRGEG